MSKEIVREQLTRTIKNKETTIRTLFTGEKAAQGKLDELQEKRTRLQLERDELVDHLDSLGGPIKKGEN